MKKDNLITIKGGAYTDVKKALKQWINMYSPHLEVGMCFKLFKNGRGNHVVQADYRLENELFYYLVNYLKYPEDIEYKVDINGFTYGKDNNELNGEKLMIYIPDWDKEYDNVYSVTTKNESYKIDFGGNIVKVDNEREYSFPDGLALEFSEDFYVKEADKERVSPLYNENSLEKRFKIVGIIFLSIYACTFFFLGGEHFSFMHFGISFGMFGWLLFDYQLLQVNKIYFTSLFFSVILVTSGAIQVFVFNMKQDPELILVGVFIPFLFLLIQRPIRYLFKLILKREPVIEKPIPTFADFIYLILMFGTPFSISMYFFTQCVKF